MKKVGMTKCPGLVVAALLALSLSAAAATIEEEAQKYQADMAEGISLLKTGSRDDISRAIAKFKSALKMRPESAEAYYWIALAYSDQNNYLRAADNAKDATIYDDKLAEAWLLWGQILLYQKEWRDSLQKLETAARLAPNDPIVLYNLGRVFYHGFKDFGSAYSKFDAVWKMSQTLRRERPELVPMLVQSRLYMGFCEFDRGRNWDNAINAFRDVLMEQPYNYDAALRLAIAYRRANRAGESEQIFRNIATAIGQPANMAERQMAAEAHLQLADLYIKDPVFRNSMLAQVHAQEFINLIGDANHPALEAAREYLAMNNRLGDGNMP